MKAETRGEEAVRQRKPRLGNTASSQRTPSFAATARRHAEGKKDFLTYFREVLALISDFQPPGL